MTMIYFTATKQLLFDKMSCNMPLIYKSFPRFLLLPSHLFTPFVIRMLHPKKVTKLFLIFFAVNTIVLPVLPLCAQNLGQNTVGQPKLLSLAKQFVEKTKKNDAYNRTLNAIDTNEQKNRRALNQIPDGQSLLLRPRIGNLIYEFDVYSIKKNNTLYFSLLDMIDILELAIDWDEDAQKGQGWFLREDWQITLDFSESVVVSRNKKFPITDQDYYEEGGEIFVSQEALSQWLYMSFMADVSQQYLEIESPYPLPGVARNYRLQKNAGVGRSNNEAKLPRQEIEYDWLDINTADVRIGTRYRRQKDADADTRYNANVTLQGQALKHEAYALASYDDRDQISSIRTRLSKRNENPVLLGPLKARSYSIGDTDLTDLPLTGDARQELGFRVSNSELVNTQFETTDINGDALPGWDIELYRNGILVSSILVDSDGRYEFSDVQLFAGDNLFEIFFYGPQGEIRNRTINIPVTEALLSSQNNTYDVSASLSDTQTYEKNEFEDIDRDSPHFVARFNKVIGNSLAYIGVRNRDIEGDNKTFVALGGTKIWNNTIFDVNTGIDDEANTAAQIVARKNINDWNLALRGLVQDEDYQAEESSNPRVLDVSFNAQKNYVISPRTKSNISVQSGYSENADGQTLFENRLGLSHQFKQYNISNTSVYEQFDSDDAFATEDRLDNTLSLRANMGRVFARGGVTYEIKPEQGVDRYFSQLSYRPSQKFSGDLFLDHEPDRDFSEARLNLNYRHKNFTTSPFVEIDSDDELYAGVNVNFNIIDQPESGMPIITSERTVGRGLVSAFVYHDKNGNKIFDESDEPLPEVTVESLNVRRRAQTNEKGYSLIRNLPSVRATDIVVDDQTLPDPYMISGFEGASIFPSPGEIVEIEFPVHMSGEIDGTAMIRERNGFVKTVKGGEIELLSLKDGKNNIVKAPIAIDGFFVVPKIPPGQYLMQVSHKTAKRFGAASPSPRIINVGYEGDTLYAQNVELLGNRKNVAINVSYQKPEYFEAATMDQPYYTLKIGQAGQSKIQGLLSKLAKSRLSPNTYQGLQKLASIGDDAETYFTGHNNSYAALHRRCEMFLDQGVACSMEVWVPPRVQTMQVARNN